MSIQVKEFKGNNLEELRQKVKREYPNGQVIDEKEVRKLLTFWRKEFEIKVIIEQKAKMVEEKTKEIINQMPNKQPVQTQTPKKQMILDILNNEDRLTEPVSKQYETVSDKHASLGKSVSSPNSEPSSNNNNEMETMKKMMEQLMDKLGDEKLKDGIKVEKEVSKAKINLDEEKENLEMNYWFERLLDIDIEEDITEKIMKDIEMNLNKEELEQKEKVEKEVINIISSMINVTGPLDPEKIKTIALVGPTGVGKTTSLAKIAGYLKHNGKKIGLITTDVYRIGATDQLQIYANILSSKMIAATTPEELKDAIDYFKNVEKVDQILIDTVGRSPMDLNSIDGIHEYMEIAKPDHTGLVLSATQKQRDMNKILENFKSVPLDSVLFTKLDETLNHGAILSVLTKNNVKISYITDGQNVPQDIYAATPEGMAKKILNGVDEFGSSIITS